jgi:DNA invertase Pin-like site-specific DNA recombinase
MSTTATTAIPSPAPAITAADAEALMGRLMQAMDTLAAMIEQETALVRVGRLREAALIEREKGDFARSYVTDLARLSASGAAVAKVAPEQAQAFRERHAEFQELLRINMTVLATAHAVSEDLIRGVSGELARRAAPQTYGSTGRPAAPSKSTVQPLAVSRSL